MQGRKCSKCDSVNVNVGDNWHREGIVIQTEGFLCLDCHNLDIQILEASTTYGKRKTLIESIQANRIWRKA